MKSNLRRHARPANQLRCCVALSLIALATSAAAGTQDSLLPTVIVNGSRFSEAAASLPFGVSVITAQDIARSGVTTINQVIAKLLGVPARQDFYGAGDDQLDLRGFGTTASSNQIVIVDGLRLDEGDSSGARLAGIQLDTVERIEVLRGSGTVLYGEGGTGGVIIITTKTGMGLEHGTQARLYAGVGSFDTREARASAGVAKGEFSFDAAVNKRQSDNFRAHFATDVQGVSVGAQWRRDKLRLALRHAQDELDADLPGALSSAQYSADPHQSNTPDAHATVRSRRTTLLGAAAMGAWEFALDLGTRDKELRSVSSWGAYDYDVSASTAALRARHQGAIQGLDNSLIVGLDAAKWKRAVLGQYGSTADQRSQALYLRDELTLSSATRLSAGARRESIRKSNSAAQGLDRVQTAWELGVVQPLSASTSLFARIGDSYRLANADEYSFTSPNVLLRPQTSRDTEVGLRWHTAASRLELRVYRNQLDDEIGYDPGAIGPWGPGANVNFDPTRRQGVELELSHALTKSVQLRGNLAWRDAQFLSGTHAGKQVPLTAHVTASLGTDWELAAGHRVGANIVYASSRHPDFDNTCQMPSYATLDLRYAYRLGAGELSLGVANAADHKYYTQAFSCTAGVTAGIYPEAGRSLNAALRWQF